MAQPVVAAVKLYPNRNRLLAAAGGVATMVVLGPMMVIVVALGGMRDPAQVLAEGATVADIPAEALAAYRNAAEHWEMDWAILAAVGKLKCDHGRYQADGCIPDTMNHAGARGYMQFIGSTWRRGLGQHELEPRTSPPAPDGHGYATDGDSDGAADPWNWLDAAHSAARLLVANNVNDNPGGALLAYNNDTNYRDQALAQAEEYRDAIRQVDGVELVTVGGIQVNASIATQVQMLLDAASADGYTLAGGGWRSSEQQISLRIAHCGSSHYAIYQMSPSDCRPPTARPGESLHEQGLAIDFTCNGRSISTRSSPCFVWLAENAHLYGLKNLPSEPWHWSTTGG